MITSLLKKNPAIDLNKLRPLFFVIGLAISLSVVTIAIEWNFKEKAQVMSLGTINDQFEELTEIPLTEQPPPKPPKKVQPVIVEVPDDQSINDEIEVELDITFDENTKVEKQEDISFLEDEPEEEKADKIFQIVEENAMPTGGMASFYNYVGNNLKYPEKALTNNVEGRVYVQFVVEKDGSITNVEVIKGIGYGCDDEAIRILKKAPAWNPGKQRGMPVRVRRVLPIIFKLQ